MALELTDVALNLAKQITVKPNLVFEIDGYPIRFGLAEIKSLIRIGDPGLLIGNDWVIGGYRLIDDQSVYQAFTNGTTTKISQQLSPDRAQGSSTSQMTISLVDKNEEISKLVSPGFDLNEILGRDAKVSIGFVDSDIDQDYNVVFRGLISDIEAGPGYVNFLLTNTEEKKRKPLTTSSTVKLSGAIGAGAITTLALDDASEFYNHVLGPDSTYDDDIEFYARIGDEYFKYTGKTGNTLTGVTRAQFGTTAIAHSDQADVANYVRLKGVGLDLALKTMLSGWGGDYVTGVAAKNFNKLDPINTVQNSIFFDRINVKDLYGLVEGDFVSTTGALNGANNVTLKRIQELDISEGGSYIVLEGVTFVDELSTSATVSFRSQFDTLPIGLKMKPTEVDVQQHVNIRDRFLSIFQLDFLQTGISAAKDYLDRQVYLAQSCFSVPRKGRSSVAFHVGPLADTRLLLLNADNVNNADKLKVKRSISKNFANIIRFQFNPDRLDGSFKTRKDYKDDDAIERLFDIEKDIQINAEGMRDSTQAPEQSRLSANRMLKRYKLGAEFIPGVEILFGDGYQTEIGDILAVDYASLKLTDFATGTRLGGIKLMECTNISVDQKTGKVFADLTNTIFATTDRFGLISPSSKVGVGSTTDKIILQKSWSTKAWQKESKKYKGYIGQHVIIHSPDWTFVEQVTIDAFDIDGQTMLVSPPLSTAPLEGYIVEAPNYPSTANTLDEYYWKSRHCSFSPQLKVVSGASSTVFDVSAPDAAKVLVGAVLRVHNYDYSSDSPEVNVVSVVGTTITVDASLGFTPDSTYYCDLVGFLDGGFAYRFI